MERISDYSIIEKIDETGKSIVYRGKSDKEDKTVVIKVLKSEQPSPSELARFKHEYNLIKNLDIEGIIKTYDFVDYNGGIALILEDFDGISLRRYLKNKEISIKSFLSMAIKIVNTLGYLHKNNIVHRDIKPENILINIEDRQLKLTDFGISSEFTRKDEEIYNPEVITGTLAYMSPEQTGRMNRTVDYRTDLYSLGVTFYEMLTGRVPFLSSDPLEIIHSHLARKPMPPVEVIPPAPFNKGGGIPKVISDIVVKLLSKMAEDRYQNSFGLLADIRECMSQLETTDKIEEFELAAKDISIKFNIPQKLFGREKEIETLMAAFDQASKGASKVMLVSGRSGIGKSAIINEIHKLIIEKKGYFLTGKFDQFRRDVPYSSIIQAFQGLASQILTESEERINIWKENLSEALGNNGKVITDVIPDLELIIGKQPEIPALGPEESQNRFNIVFKNFLSVFTKEEHPLALFLDDMQWADSASLGLIKTTITDPDIQYLFLIGAYRDNEVSDSHLIMIALEEIKKSGITVNSISLSPLGITAVTQLIANFLRCEEKKALRFAELVNQKTGGNPFFVNQFLKTLYDEGALKIDPALGWLWDLDEISQMQVTDNVVELLTGKINRLPESVQEVLNICACIGNRFELEVVSAIYEKSFDETLSVINEIVDEDFAVISGDMYQFQHDRIKEAAYFLIPDEEKSRMHLRIGRLALKDTSEEDLTKRIFYIVNQFNKGANLLSDQEERIKLAELNLLAGKKAKVSAGYSSAVSYLRIGTDLLPEERWQNNYELTYSLYIEGMECEYLDRNFEKAEKLFDIILKNAKTNVEKVNAYNIMSELYSNINKFEEAVSLGLQCMKMLGLKVSASPSKLSVLVNLIKTKWNLRNRKIEDLYDLPEMKDPEKLLLINVIMSMGAAAFTVSQELFALLSFKAVNIFLKYGNSDTAPSLFLSYGGIISTALGDYETGYKFGELALRLNKKLYNKKFNCTLYFSFAYFLQHWRKHARDGIKFFDDAYREGLENGDFILTGHSINARALYRSIIGNKLDDVFEQYKKYQDFQYKIKDPLVIAVYFDSIQMFLNLKGETRSKYSLDSGDYNEEKRLDNLKKEKESADFYLYLLARLRILYLYGAYNRCSEMITEMNRVTIIPEGTLYVTEYNFNSSLTLTALYSTANAGKRRKFRKIIKKNQKKMKKWAENSPENFLHKYLLVSAEMERIDGNYEKTAKLYHDAIISARENGYTQNEAIACELAAKFYYSKGLDEIAGQYIREARYRYLKWGATAKVKDLEEKYPDLVSTAPLRRQIDTLTDTTTDSSTAGASEIMDISTIMKASQAISGEIILEKLLSTMMKIVIENAGAQKGFLILEEGGKSLIEARGVIDSNEIAVLQSMPVDTSKELSPAIVKYVKRTKENLILNDAANEGIFTSDAYIIKNRPKSILCAPIINQGRLTGILYLENNLSKDAFTPERIELLRAISSQIAISIDNAQLYANLEEKVKERTAELHESNTKLQQAMDALWGEMELAKKIQTALLPADPLIEGYEIIGHMTPADEVGGDYYDVINGEDVDWVIIGDVSGHGVPAGLVMMMVQTCIQAVIRDDPHIKPTSLLNIVNRAVSYNVQKLKEDKYMTITALAFYKDGRVVYSGLHQDIYIYRVLTGSVDTIETDGMWLGILFDLGRMNEDFEFEIKEGDVMLLYTDGITEAMNRDDEMFGNEELKKVFCSYGKDPLDEIKNAILNSLTDYICNDDVTMVVMKRNG